MSGVKEGTVINPGEAHLLVAGFIDTDNTVKRLHDNTGAGGGGGGDASAANQATQITQLGATNETIAPTDTATSGLNGLLKRVSSHLQLLRSVFPATIGRKTSAGSTSVTLSSDEATTTYVRAGTLSITVANTAQTVFTAGTLTKGFSIINTSTAWMYISMDGADPSIGVGIPLAPADVVGQQGGGWTEDKPPTAAVRIISATAGATFYAWGA